MAQLFGKGTLKEHIQNLNGFDQSKIDIIQDLYNDYKNGLLNDEVKYKEKFNKVFFGDLLGYQDRIHRIPEGTISGTGNADLIFGNFEDGKEDAEKIQIVCELKGARSNLTKKQFGHGGLSPVGQGFAYKTGLKNCKWLMVSNFYEIKFYRDNQTDSEEWNLQMLLDPKDDYFNLKSLFLLLQKDNLLAKEGLSNTEKLLSHFRDEQQKITKNFYKEYKELRIDLIKDMKKNNPNISVNTLVEKAQKIIDRLIFIFFCEDKGLLPDKKLKEGVFNAGQRGFSPREMTKRFFVGVNSGSEKLEIPDGYNGGLFKEDSILNNLVVGDEICRKFIDLTNYDFDDELSVNVLGHIFEQSISDLEELKEDLIGRETKDNGKGKRKKDGIFYTPEYIVDYIVQNSVMKYLNEKEDECLNKHKNKKNGELLAYQEYQQILQNIKVLDPACGSGAFLVRVFDVLFEENKRVGSILNSLFDDAETYKNILTNNIYGVDLNAESVEITKLSLWLKSAQKGKKLNNLDANIKCGNSLIDDKTITDKAFDWNTEFKEIMGRGGFDVVVGNPPYGADIQGIKQESNETYLLFYKLGIGLLRTSGILSFITPDSRLINDNAGFIRKFFIDNGKILNIYDVYKVFSDAPDVRCNIVVFQKNSKSDIVEISRDKPYDSKIFQFNLNWKRITNYGKGKWFVYINEDLDKIFSKMNDFNKIKSYFDVKRGFSPTPNEKNLTNNKTNRQVIGGEDFGRYHNKIKPKYLIEDYEKSREQINLVKNLDFIGIQRIRTNSLDFNSRWIISQYFNNGYVPIDSIGYFIKNGKLELKYLLSVLNSSLLNIYYKLHYTDKNVKPIYLKELPIKEITFSEQQPFIERADKMLSLNKELHELTDKFFNRIKDNLKVEKITKKLESFYEGEFKDFLDELKKQKIALSLSDQDQREPYFKEYKEKILLLKGEIERTDKEIDEMVFDLYGLNEEERKVILGG